MKKSNIYVCQLTESEQKQIREALLLGMENEPNIEKIVDNEAMCSRLCDLEDIIDISLIVPSIAE